MRSRIQFGNPIERGEVERVGCRAGADGGALVPLVDRVVVAVPVQPEPLPHPLIPQRRQIGGARPCRRCRNGFPSANIALYGLNVSTRPGPCGGRLSNQAMFGSRSRMPLLVRPMTSSLVDDAVEEAELGMLLHRRDERVGVEPGILGDGRQEPRIALQIHLMRGHAHHDRRRGAGAVPVRADVTRRAVQADARNEVAAPGRADRQVARRRLVGESQPRVAGAGTIRQLVGEALPEARGTPSTGTPTVPSVPIEPYLNSVTMSVCACGRRDVPRRRQAPRTQRPR